MIAKWGFGPMVARLTSWRNPFHVVSRKQLYESRIFGHPEETRGYPNVSEAISTLGAPISGLPTSIRRCGAP